VIEDAGIGAEVALPEAVAEDDDGMVAFAGIVGFVDDAADLGADAERLEVGSGDGLDANHIRLLAVVDEAVDVVFEAEDGRGVGEDVVLALKLAVEGIGVELGAGEAVGNAAPVFDAELDKPLRVFDGERTQHHGIEKAENRGVGADAQSQGDERDDGDGGCAQHGAQAIAGVLEEGFEPTPAPCGLAVLAEEGGIAETLVRGVAGRVGGETGGDLLLATQVEVQAHLFVKLTLKAAAMEEHVESSSKFAREAHVVLLQAV